MAFKRTDQIVFAFKLLAFNEIVNEFDFGIVGDENKNDSFWPSSGNIIRLSEKKLDSRYTFKNLVKKWPGEVLFSNMIIIAEICVEKNILKIYDESKTLINLENEFAFENLENWRIMFGTYFEKAKYTIEILKFYIKK